MKLHKNIVNGIARWGDKVGGGVTPRRSGIPARGCRAGAYLKAEGSALALQIGRPKQVRRLRLPSAFREQLILGAATLPPTMAGARNHG
jgi:hypothetical protein